MQKKEESRNFRKFKIQKKIENQKQMESRKFRKFKFQKIQKSKNNRIQKIYNAQK